MRVLFKNVYLRKIINIKISMMQLKPLSVILISFAISLVASSCNSNSTKKSKEGLNEKEQNLNRYVNNFIGTGEHGHTYPGAQVPFGMVQLSPDNGVSGWDWVSGYHISDSIIVGFSHTHLSGAGIGDLQDISVMPTMADFDISKNFKTREEKPYADFYSHDNEKASPGYYQVLLKKQEINVELTATNRTGFHKYIFNKEGSRNIVLDLDYAVNWDATVKSEIKIESETVVSGYRYSSGWANNQKVFFVMEFSEPIQKSKLSVDGRIIEATNVNGKATKALFYFDKKLKNILVKVGISAVSLEGAKNNLKEENPNFDFDLIKSHAQSEWNKNLNGIVVEGRNKDLKTVFYSSLYHTKLAPTTYSDVDGKYRGGDQKVYSAEGFNYMTGLSLWDVFRAHNPLMTIVEPKISADIANTMLAFYDETGTLPVWILAGNETNTMTGYHSVSMLAEVILKDLPGVDYKKAFEAMKATMMQNQRGLKELREYGYVPFDTMDESVTISLELAYNDYGVAEVAKKLGYIDDYKYFLNRSMAYKHLFDKTVGFMRGKDTGGKWRPNFDPKHSAHRKGTDYTEGNAWQHSWFVLHDIQGLVNEFGGVAPFEKQLTQLFNESSEITGDNASPDITGLIGQYAHGNEPSHHIAYMYNYIGQPWKTQELVHKIMKEQYPNSPEGISGNEDMGQMSAWYVVSALGFYPVNPTDGNFIIGTPMFDKVTIKLEDNKTFVITAKGVSDTNYYIQSAKLNGKELNRNYFTYKELMQGGTLEFVMGDKPNKNWGSDMNLLPSSVSKIILEK
jgi:predicted alpha-1,2-mannosidase